MRNLKTTLLTLCLLQAMPYVASAEPVFCPTLTQFHIPPDNGWKMSQLTFRLVDLRVLKETGKLELFCSYGSAQDETNRISTIKDVDDKYSSCTVIKGMFPRFDCTPK